MRPRVHNICGNRRRRKLWRREGDVTLYLYSGEKSGYTYERAVKELGGDHRKVIQVDLKNGSKWDMVHGHVYEELLSMALDGQISTVLTSPNCRTRSKLRHVEIPGMNGADASSLRLVLSLGARKGWGGYNMDVRTAFLNAPWKGEKRFEDSEDEEDSKPVIIKPPGILVSLGYFTADQGWEVHRALYGFRQSPKLWSDYRGQELGEMRVGDFYLHQLESESCIWLMKKPEGDVRRWLTSTRKRRTGEIMGEGDPKEVGSVRTRGSTRRNPNAIFGNGIE